MVEHLLLSMARKLLLFLVAFLYAIGFVETS